MTTTIKSVNQTSEKIGKLSTDVDQLANGDAKRVLTNLSDTATEIKGVTADVRATVAKLQGPTTDFATNGLPQISQAIVSLKDAAESLNRVVQEIESNPQGVLSKPPAKERELKP